MVNHEYLIWIDLEMTGLLPDSDQIIEIATVVTDKDLNIIAEGPELAIHQPEEVLARMDAWNQRQHGSSGSARAGARQPHDTGGGRAPDTAVPERCTCRPGYRRCAATASVRTAAFLRD